MQPNEFRPLFVLDAIKWLENKMRVTSYTFDSPGIVKDYLQLNIADSERECFHVLFLDSQHKLIHSECMFKGTVNSTSVYPREVVKTALQHNASAVILAHNHPSGLCTPSRADEMLTQTLKDALKVVDIKVLDHFIVTIRECYSFAENWLL